jgi:drug/metabolite transporter (DMT)-like permease
VNVTWSIVAALASAGCAAIASVLQHRTVGAAPAGRGMRLSLIWHLLRRPVWLAGFAASAAALGFHALALRTGDLTLVQPILVSGLLFALPASALLHARRPSLAEWLWAALLIAGLAIFLDSGRPSAGTRFPDESRLWATMAVAAAVAAVAVLLAAKPARRIRAALLGLATGIAYGMVAGLIKFVVALAPNGAAAVFADWPLYVLIGIGAIAVILNQTAYQSGPLAASLPALTLADPVTGALIGAIAYGERLASDPWAIVGQLIGIAAVTVAIVQLARRTVGPRDSLGPRAPRRSVESSGAGDGGSPRDSGDGPRPAARSTPHSTQQPLPGSARGGPGTSG